MAQDVGKLEAFDASSDSITAYMERAELYMEANDTPEEKQVAVFLTAMGANTYSLLRDLLTPAAPKDKSFADIVEVLKSHFEPKPLEISECFHFNQRQQAAGESVSKCTAILEIFWSKLSETDLCVAYGAKGHRRSC